MCGLAAHPFFTLLEWQRGMPTSYSLSLTSYICLDPCYCVLLDARSDRYLAISRDTMERLGPWLSGWPADPSQACTTVMPAELASIADDFVRRGTLTKGPFLGKPVRPQDIPRPQRSLLDAHEPVPLIMTLPLAGALICSSLWARRQLTRHPLLSTIGAVAERRASSQRSPSAALDLDRARFLVSTFTRWLVFSSKPNDCLFEALALLHFLSRFQIYPSWVFGVIPEPFHAHCWLQHRGIVVNDTVAHVSQYAPLMLI